MDALLYVQMKRVPIESRNGCVVTSLRSLCTIVVKGELPGSSTLQKWEPLIR
jgi:hypothetical protein